MLVKDMIKAIDSKGLKIDDLAKQYGFSDRSIQSKIKDLGFVWDAKEGKYNFVGSDDSVYDLAIDKVFKRASRSDSKSNVKKEVKRAVKEITDTSQNEGEIASNKESKRVSKKNIDNIDRLLAGKKAKKEYRGFYLDSDIADIIDSVGSGIKSELVNECLRKVFKDKGLL